MTVSSTQSTAELINSIDSIRSFTASGDFHNAASDAMDIAENSSDWELADLARDVVELADHAGDLIDDAHDAIKALVEHWAEINPGD